MNSMKKDARRQFLHNKILTAPSQNKPLILTGVRAICLLIRLISFIGAVAAWPAGMIAAEPDTPYRIETLAGNGKPGDIPDGGGKATEIPVDLPFGVGNGPDGALYITTVGSHRVLRFDRKGGTIRSVAGTGRKGYAGDGGPATQAMLNEPYEVRFDSRGNMFILLSPAKPMALFS